MVLTFPQIIFPTLVVRVETRYKISVCVEQSLDFYYCRVIVFVGKIHKKKKTASGVLMSSVFPSFA